MAAEASYIVGGIKDEDVNQPNIDDYYYAQQQIDRLLILEGRNLSHRFMSNETIL